MKRARNNEGCISLDKRSGSWQFFWCEDGKRRSKTLGTQAELPSKSAAWRAAKHLRQALENNKPVVVKNSVTTVRDLIEAYRQEKMPKRVDTSRGYESWINVHILPQWSDAEITDLQARPVQLWIDSLDLAPKSKVHVRGILGSLWNFAMWRQDIPMQVNPISLVTIKGATKRVRQPRILTAEEFSMLVSHLPEPFATLALVCVCFGLRISEALALRFSDVDWLNGTLQIERGIVAQVVDSTKTEGSCKALPIAPELLERLKVWKQSTPFPAGDDWIFASPQKLGRLPYSYTGVSRILRRAAKEAGIGHLSTHCFRHSHRSWLGSIGTPLGVQQKLMRHSTIAMTMRYGDALTADMREAHGKIVNLALLNCTETARKSQ